MSEIPQIINHFTDDDLYKFTMCCAVIDNYPRAMVKYEFIDRGNTVYPDNFAIELKRQVKLLENVVITDEEIAFMKRKCPYIPYWFYTYLKGYRYNSDNVQCSQDENGRLHISFNGYWSETILLEVKVLAIVSELYYIMTNKNVIIENEDYYTKSWKKAEILLKHGCVFSDFGTRRRASFRSQEICINAMVDCMKSYDWGYNTGGKFSGTSNVYMAMKYNLTPIGTCAHEFICGIAGIYGGPQMANHLAMEAWKNTYRGSLGIWLYDTYGFDIFSLNFSEDYANLYKGLRVDSGDNFEQLKKITQKYRDLKIDPKNKQIVFSNSLDVQKAIQIQDIAKHVCQPSYGIGTHFTNDYDGLKPMNIVIKLTAIKITESWNFYNDTCKLSEEDGKHCGKDDVVKRFISVLPQFNKGK